VIAKHESFHAYNASRVRTLPDDILDRMVNAVERVRERLVRASKALESAGVPYAIAGGNAVAAWVATVDPAAVRNTQDVDVLLRRPDFARAKLALESAGFVHRHAASLDLFLDSPSGNAREAVHIVFANEYIKAGEFAPSPDVAESQEGSGFRLLTLDALVRVKLTAFRRKDQVHLLDMIAVGLIDASWTAKLPTALAQRLQSLLDDPNG
jgi:hypothetical protein